MSKFASLLVSSLIAVTAVAQTIAVDLETGRYVGIDQFGQACMLDIVSSEDEGEGAGKLDAFVFQTPGFNYRVNLQGPAQTSTPGTLVHKTSLMFDEYRQGRMWYRSIIGAPIFGKMIKTDFEITYRDGHPVSLKLTKTSTGLLGSRKTTELCNRLEK